MVWQTRQQFLLKRIDLNADGADLVDFRRFLFRICLKEIRENQLNQHHQRSNYPPQYF